MSDKQTGTNALLDYWTDAAQRYVLSLDVLRQRGNDYVAHAAMKAPNVLSFEVELVPDGRQLERPVNYLLTRMIPPEGSENRSAQAALHRRRSARRAMARESAE